MRGWDEVQAERRKRLFDRIKANTHADIGKATLFGVQIDSMSPEELRIALGWALSENQKMLARPISLAEHIFNSKGLIR